MRFDSVSFSPPSPWAGESLDAGLLAPEGTADWHVGVSDRVSGPTVRSSLGRAELTEEAVTMRDVQHAFDGRTVLKGIDLTVRSGEFVSLIGASGAGKTTLLRILAGLERADQGHIRVPQVRSVVFQEPRLVPSRRVWRNVVIGHPRIRSARPDAVRALGEVGLDRHADGWPRTLSGGEAQRVALARALVTEPGLLLLDEPFAALDALTRMRMVDLVGDLWRKHRPAVVLVTHDLDEAMQLSDRIVVLKNGAIDTDIDVAKALGTYQALAPDRARLALRTTLLAALGVTP